MKRTSIQTLYSKKDNNEKIVMITAYSARMAQLIDPHTDIILVGDSLAMTLHGFQSTLQATMDMMIYAAQAVDRGRNNAMMVVDLPFSSYETSPEYAYKSASEIMQKTGAEAVKIEGGSIMKETISFLTSRNIPVMGHVGLLPQSVNKYGGYGSRGKTKTEQKSLLQDIKDVNSAGAFAIVIEGVVEEIAIKMTLSVDCPTIGIGASKDCDGQVLVSDDLLGITEKNAKFVKEYSDLKTDISNSIKEFSREVRNGTFPSKDKLY